MADASDDDDPCKTPPEFRNHVKAGDTLLTGISVAQFLTRFAGMGNNKEGLQKKNPKQCIQSEANDAGGAELYELKGAPGDDTTSAPKATGSKSK